MAMTGLAVRIWILLVIISGFWASVGAQETRDFVRFPDGVEVLAAGGRLRPADVKAALVRAEARIAEGQLGLAQRILKMAEARAGGAVPRAAELRQRIRQVEFSSAVILRDGRRIEGRLRDPFRADRLGLETKRDISPDLVRQITVKYHLNWSNVSHTFYPLTLVQTEFRDGRTLVGRMTQETPVTLETPDGRLVEVMIGCAYRLLRKEHLDNEMVEGDHVAQILIYPALNHVAP